MEFNLDREKIIARRCIDCKSYTNMINERLEPSEDCKKHLQDGTEFLCRNKQQDTDWEVKKLKRYKVIRCKNCGKISMSMAEKVFKCNYCGKSEQIFKERMLGVAVRLLRDFDSPQEASIFCRISKDYYENKGNLIGKGFYGGKDERKPVS